MMYSQDFSPETQYLIMAMLSTPSTKVIQFIENFVVNAMFTTATAGRHKNSGADQANIDC